MLAAGFGKREITPPIGTPCALGLDNEAQEIYDPIFIRAIALTDAGHTVFILSADVLGLYAVEDQMIRSEVAQRVRVPVDHVIVHGTHTHESPCVRVEYGRYLAERGLKAYSPEFWAQFREAAVEAAAQASRSIAPAEVRYGEAPVEGIASNRRLRMPDGTVVMRGSRDSEQKREYPVGDIDPLVRVVSLKRDGDEIVLLNYCCHPSAAGGDEGPYITGDFPGYAIQEIEQTLVNSSAIHFTGPCGNVNPGKFTGWRSRRDDAAAMGALLAAGALRARESAEPVDGSSLRFKVAPVELPLRENIASQAELEARVEADIADYRRRRDAGETVPGGGPLLNDLLRLQLLRRVGRGPIETRIAGLAYGDLALIFLPGECFLELNHTIRWNYGKARVVCVENCDYTPSYIPTPEAYLPEAQGYEGRVAIVSPEAFGIVGQAACGLFSDLSS
ncbi:MAG: neutral/alkaline non-lysosomal ceramidase N-terminal domain-containing protein [Armatimonadetes bacterium]|nr:neutral/alkaline non-lysosomal ceramidase N-terminal domain-containing protein [Armatimonadota bacterium]